MRARKFTKRDRTTTGRATGVLLCRLSLPAIEQEYDWQVHPGNSAKAVGLIRKFIDRHLPQNPDFLINGRFVIEAEIRASKSSLGRRRLAVWNDGDELSSIFEQAAEAWSALEFEEDYTVFEVEI